MMPGIVAADGASAPATHAMGVEQRRPKEPGAAWIYAYLAVQIGCQLALLPSALAPGRIVYRSAAFGTSLLFCLLVPGRPLVSSPVRIGVFVILMIVTLSAFNPESAGPLAALAHLAFYASVLAPTIWVPRLKLDPRSLERLLVVLWALSTASAAVGVLQAYFPGQFQPNIAMLAAENGKQRLEAVMIRLNSGDWIPRPMGLTDTPGGAAYGGFYAALLGLGIGFRRPFPFARLAAGSSMMVGATCLYLCQIRSLMVMLLICFLAVIVIFAFSGRLSRSGVAAAGAVALGVGGLYLAISLGGQDVSNRVATLVASDVGTVYYHTRGSFLERTFVTYLPDYPLGAGLGRWGMVNQYFAGGRNSLWAEIQLTGWLFDGGILLLIAYPVTVVAAVWQGARTALRHWSSPELDGWAAVIGGYNVGALALTFSSPLFMSTAGVEFWLINATLLQVARLRSKAMVSERG